MLWYWWGGMLIAGLGLGCLGAWTTHGWRVVMKTLAIPLCLVLSRLLWPHLYPIKNTPLYLMIDLGLLAIAALVGDYLLGLKLGRHDKAGFRSDSVGH